MGDPAISTLLAATQLEHFPRSADDFKNRAISSTVLSLNLILDEIGGEQTPGCHVDEASCERVREACSKIWQTLQVATWTANPAGKRVLAARADLGVQALLARAARG